MARNKGTFNFAANFQVKMQEALDPRVSVATKEALIAKETWPYDGDTLYLYEGLLVSVASEQSVYMLTDITKALSSDYSGWVRVDAGNAEQVEVIDNVTSTSTTAALSANQGKVLMDEISGVKEKLVNIYTYKGSKNAYTDLPTEGVVAGDVWNVAEAYDDYPAGTNFAWTGEEWDALGGPIDLSVYYTKSETDDEIQAVKDSYDEQLKTISENISTNATNIATLQGSVADNKSGLESVTKSVGDINLLLNGNDDDTDDIPNQIGLVGRVEAVEGLIGTPTDEDKSNTMLSRLNALEELVTGGDSGEGEGSTDQTLLQKVNQNTLDIAALEGVVGSNTSGSETGLYKLIKNNTDAIALLNDEATVEGSVDYKIEQAFAWTEVQ